MENLDPTYLSRAETWLLANLFVYFLMNGAQIFETLVLVPKWTAAPPATFNYLSDSNGVSLKTFWTVFHSVHEVIFMLSIWFCWQLPTIRNWLLILFTLHFIIRVWTLAYFAPNIINFQKMAEGSLSPTPDLADKANTWKKRNYLRVAMFMAISIAMLPVLFKLTSHQ